MKLSEIQKQIASIRIFNDQIISLEQIKRDNQSFQKNDVFVAIKGNSWDGHSFIEEAAKTASLVVIEDPQYVEVLQMAKCNFWYAANARKALTDLLAILVNSKLQEMGFIGITGTNGKTSLSNLLEQAYECSGESIGVIGTIDHHYKNQVWPTKLTSPGPIELVHRLIEMSEAGAHKIAMEVSSHALDQYRADSIRFKAAVFLNLTQDHLDYHHSMENYFRAKCRLFTDLLTEDGIAVINKDDPYGQRLMDLPIKNKKVSFGRLGSSADYNYEILEESLSSLKINVKSNSHQEELSLNLLGSYNAENFVAALAVANEMIPNFSWKHFAQNTKPIRGRLERVENEKELHCFVDYAHTPDALLKALQAINNANLKKKKVHCVFGAGGDRDKTKRPLMAKAAESLADFIYVTSDNPRTEDPQAIIDDIFEGFKKKKSKKIFSEIDRKKAMQMAVNNAKLGDVILVAGKGHEDYQEINGERLFFSDVQALKEILGN
ncbi:MAG: UDP-N-acetylmuramoyl-L-alanyl-D-glutamate--2,6-diaminopimelate ligase [Bdellovibrionaceae bacterium]|nr:UDP-N-acetylmuramoyl-L-alanyl-D-glutamate--2,6-diaminopimelate ligase [Pseudobdellovibrionaceae bacterium]|tara:strand:+ start:85771 stop:87246 length:1476 start_codon:yes stop_codon:yes gene_type:complete